MTSEMSTMHQDIQMCFQERKPQTRSLLSSSRPLKLITTLWMALRLMAKSLLTNSLSTTRIYPPPWIMMSTLPLWWTTLGTSQETQTHTRNRKRAGPTNLLRRRMPSLDSHIKATRQARMLWRWLLRGVEWLVLKTHWVQQPNSIRTTSRARDRCQVLQTPVKCGESKLVTTRELELKARITH